MLFHTTVFAIFLPAVLFLYLLLGRRWITPMLVIASYIFYGWVEPKYTALMLVSSIIDFYVALKFSERNDRALRIRGLWISALFNFGVLFYFKYSNFAVENVRNIFSAMGYSLPPFSIEVVLPLGISFYTFHTFSYSVDVLTGKIPPCRSLVKFMLFVSYFPQLVAGPIARGEQMIPELDKIEKNRFSMVARIPEVMVLFAEGWMRKAFADWVAITANGFFGSSDILHASTSDAIWGIVAFSIQIYGDFSGYTRMAQGVSWIFGVRLAENFNIPYIASDPQEFWRRWHISLSSWFRDYVYIPLGGSRKGTIRSYSNQVFTMLLSGLWHGASWNFVLWGAIHSFYLVTEKLLHKYWVGVPKLIKIPVMWILVFAAWVPFRAADFKTTIACFRALSNGGMHGPTTNLIAGILGIVMCDSLQSLLRKKESLKTEWSAAFWTTLAFLVWGTNQLLWNVHDNTFIYFQF